MFRNFVSVLTFVLLLSGFAQAKEEYPGQYAQVSPEIKEFFKNYNYPNPERSDHPGYNCCNESDCHILTADLWDVRGGKFWVLAQKKNLLKELVEERWIEVPEGRVITKYGNPTNGAIACYQWYSTDPSFYCFTPGDLL